MLRLNTMLIKRGFTNITQNYGLGKVNAQWVNSNGVKVVRHKNINKTVVTINDLSFNLPEQEILLKDYILKNY